MSSINFQKIYFLESYYPAVKDRAMQILGNYLQQTDLFTFEDRSKTITFTSERLIPTIFTNRPRVMLLFSNPHPNSITQGMFLSPNTKGRENLFWCAISDAEWINIQKQNPSPPELAGICLDIDYQGPFEFIFYSYYSFPTNYPEDIIKIFGNDFFLQVIEPEANDEFKKTIETIDLDAIVAFNKGIFNLVSEDHVNLYIDRLTSGEVIQSRIKGLDKGIPIFLTYPTGWRYHKQYKELRMKSLARIKKGIYRYLEKE